MNRITLICCVFLLSLTTYAQQALVPVDAGSKIHFTIKNFGFNTGGDFGGLKGSILFNPANPGASTINVTVDANTINTDNKKRDEHLRKAEYFDVAKYPVLQFISTKVIKAADGSYSMAGTMIIKGVSKVVSFPFKVTTLSVGYLFQCNIELNRQDFGVGGSSAVLSDNLKVALSIFAK